MSDLAPPTAPVPLEGPALERARVMLDAAAQQARQGTCLRSLCGSVVADASGAIIGEGSNSLPGGCAPSVCAKEEPGFIGPGFKSDRTCCVHAEVRAITAALRTGADLTGSSVYFTRVDASGARVVSGRPYCTICSKFALDTGVAFFVLEHDFGVVAYPTGLYNDLSFTYGR